MITRDSVPLSTPVKAFIAFHLRPFLSLKLAQLKNTRKRGLVCLHLSQSVNFSLRNK